MSNATPIQGHYDTSSVFVAVIGRPNVGKSSLTNLLVGEKVAIVTSKPQTTRTRITGVITRGPLQYVLLDTPGVHKARNKLGKRMDKTASDSIADVDVSMMLFEPYGALNESEMVLVDMLLLHTTGVTVTVALVVCMTLAVTVVCAKFVGCTLPMLAQKVGFDPAVMASPFITTIVDALSLLVYFRFATMILHL